MVGRNVECTDDVIVTSEKVNNMTKKCVVDGKASTDILNLQSRFEISCLWIMIWCNLFKNKLISYTFGMFVMLVMSMTVLYKLSAQMSCGVGCPMYMVSGAIQCLTMNGVTSCNLDLKYRIIEMCKLLTHSVNCLFAQILNGARFIACGFNSDASSNYSMY